MHDFATSVSAAILLAVILYPITKKYVLLPLKLWKVCRFDGEPRFEPADQSRLPREVTSVFDSAAPQLSADGFRMLACLKRSVTETRQEEFVCLWANPSAGVGAQVFALLTPKPTAAGGGVAALTGASFRTDFEDGTTVATSQSDYPDHSPSDPKCSILGCPPLHDLALLYELHRAHARREGKESQPVREGLDNWAHWMRRDWNESRVREITRGYYRTNSVSGRWELTLKGAFLMTWHTLGPQRRRREARHACRVNRALQELGFGDFQTLRGRQRPLSALPAPPTFDTHVVRKGAEAEVS